MDLVVVVVGVDFPEFGCFVDIKERGDNVRFGSAGKGDVGSDIGPPVGVAVG